MKDLNEEFANAVRAILAWAYEYSTTGYITEKDAAPFVMNLPEFWREPARVMACSGYYDSADQWMKDNVGDLP